MRDERSGIPTADHELGRKLYRLSFNGLNPPHTRTISTISYSVTVGSEAIDWMTRRLQLATNDEGVKLGQHMIDTGHIKTAQKKQTTFINSDRAIYRFFDDHQKLAAMQQLAISTESDDAAGTATGPASSLSPEQRAKIKAEREKALISGLSQGMGF